MRTLKYGVIALSTAVVAPLGCGPALEDGEPPAVGGGGPFGSGTTGDTDGDPFEPTTPLDDDGPGETGPSEPEVPSEFEIDLVFVTPVNDASFDAFERARLRWEQVILNAQAPVTGSLAEFAQTCGYAVDDEEVDNRGVTIFVELAPIDGTGDGQRNILGQAGPCLLRDDGSPAFGGMTFDSVDLDFLAAQGLLEAVVLHEMGHVLGIGTLWGFEGLLENPSVPDNAGADTFFTGPSAQTAFLDILGGQPFGGSIVPVENSGRRGSGDGHWRESVLRNELMSPSLDPPGVGNPLSVLTIASLQDLGFYETNLDAADAYRVPLSAESSLPTAATGPVHDCILMHPVGTIHD